MPISHTEPFAPTAISVAVPGRGVKGEGGGPGSETVMIVAAVAGAYPSVESAAWAATITQSPNVAKLNVPLVEPTVQTEGVLEV